MLTGRDLCKPLIQLSTQSAVTANTRTNQTWLCLARSRKALRREAPPSSFRNLFQCCTILTLKKNLAPSTL